jgi:hypothetical protein
LNGTVKTYDDITITNNIASTLVKTMAVSIGETVVSNYDNFFLRNAMDNLLHTPAIQQDSLVRYSQHFYEMGSKADSYGTDSWNNRAKITRDGNSFEIIIPLNVDLASSIKFFPPGSDIKITIGLNTPDFYLVKPGTETHSHHIVVDDIYLRATRASVLPSLAEAHQRLFAQKKAVYALRYLRTTEKIIPSGTTSMEYDIFLPGQVPYNLTFVMLPSTTFTGDSATEPLFFEQHGLSSACLRTENKSIEYDFNDIRSAYYANMRALNEKNVDITLPEYEKEGRFFVYFDLSDSTPDGAMRPVTRTNLRLAIKWSKATEKALTLLMLAESVGHLEIDSHQSTKLIVV